MIYAVINNGAIENRIELDPSKVDPVQFAARIGRQLVADASDVSQIGGSWDGVQFQPAPPVVQTILASDVFLARLTDAEYGAFVQGAQAAMSSGDATIVRWFDDARRRQVDVSSALTLSIKAKLVSRGVFTATRADEIFATG